MILFDNPRYRIERIRGTPKPVALDHKEQSNGRVCLVNLGWFDCYEHALRAMGDHYNAICAATNNLTESAQ